MIQVKSDNGKGVYSHINRTEPTFYRTIFLLSVPANQMQLFIHGSTPNIHPRLDLRIQPEFSDWCEGFGFGSSFVVWLFSGVYLLLCVQYIFVYMCSDLLL